MHIIKRIHKEKATCVISWILGLETVVPASPSPHANLSVSINLFITPETDADGLGAPDVSFYPQAINHGNALCAMQPFML